MLRDLEMRQEAQIMGTQSQLLQFQRNAVEANTMYLNEEAL